MDLPSLLMAGSLDTLTSYFSVAFLVIFLPVSVVVYAVIPQKARKYFLLIASFAFFWLISGQLIAYLCLIIMGVHYFGLWLDRIQTQKSAALKAVPREEKKALKKVYLHRSRRVLLFAAVLMIGGLLVIKYSPFFTTNVNSLLLLLNIPIQFDIPSYIMPIGISFFTLQAVSYLFDVYRGLIKADDNILRLALFMSFFPQIVEGPICRYGQTANQLWNVKQIEFENLKLGAVRILFGLMKKLVIADRLNPMIKQIFSHYDDYQGGIIALGAIAYTIQLYCDFSGTMDAVMGVAQIFGVTMPEKLSKTFLLKINFRILEKVAYYTRHMVQGLYLLSRHHVKADEKSYIFRTQKAWQPLWPVACGKHSVVLCMVLQRTVARFCVGLHILRYVPLCAYSVGQHHCPCGYRIQ